MFYLSVDLKELQSTPVHCASPQEMHGELCLQKEFEGSESVTSNRLGKEQCFTYENKIKIVVVKKKSK